MKHFIHTFQKHNLWYIKCSILKMFFNLSVVMGIYIYCYLL
uniref:Uncharacterized protein n=1 Tax=Anguilla anguilla TaxID=7936 RepID=A0A0E9XK00_ANGAN